MIATAEASSPPGAVATEQSDARSSAGWYKRTLGELCHDALVHAAKLKCEALKARKLAERVFDRILLETEGKSVNEREAKARVDPRYIAAEDTAITSESDAIVAKAKADGIQIRFEEFRTNAATSRAEMQLR